MSCRSLSKWTLFIILFLILQILFKLQTVEATNAFHFAKCHCVDFGKKNEGTVKGPDG